MEIISEWGFVFMIMAVIFGFYMTWGIGANDVANAMGTSVVRVQLRLSRQLLLPQYLNLPVPSLLVVQ